MPLALGGQATPVSFQRELLTGSIPNSQQFRVTGYNGDVGTTQEDIWEVGGLYAYPPVGGIQMRAVSTSASDTAAGTGARTVRITYLDANYYTQHETITLNGTTPVNTVATNILRVQDFHVATVGSSDTGSAGDISLTNMAGSVTYSKMSTSVNRARQALYTVPVGKRAFIVVWRVGGVIDANINAFTWIRATLRATCDWEFVRTDRVFQSKSQAMLKDTTLNTTFGVPITLPEKTDIKIIVSGSHDGCICTGGFEGWTENA